MPVTNPVNYDYLIDNLRLHLGDTDPATYRYADNWLRTALVMAMKGLQNWWNFKYLVDDTTYNASRNPNTVFLMPEPPIIQHNDERPIILYAAILLKGGSLENSAYSVGSWRDAEIAYSNIEGGKMRESSISRDVAELEGILKPPQKRLAYPTKKHLPGYLNNEYERKGIL